MSKGIAAKGGLTNKQAADIVRRALLMLVRLVENRLVEKMYDLKDHTCPHCLNDYTEPPDMGGAV
jgi:hypothetical protein